MNKKNEKTVVKPLIFGIATIIRGEMRENCRYVF